MNPTQQIVVLGRSRRAFTIAEMLVVVSIVVILIVLAVPAFQAMLRGGEATLAENQLKLALRAARDAAIRSSGGSDGCAAFFFTDEGRLQIVPYVKAGVLSDEALDEAGNRTSVDREIFVTAPGTQSLQLPKGWTVRGYAPASQVESSTDWGWYTSVGMGSTRYEEGEGNWLLPETSILNPQLADAGVNRNTFIVRFQGSTGRLAVTPSDSVLLLAPAMEPAAVAQLPNGVAELRQGAAQDPARYVQSILRGLGSGGTTLRLDDKRRVLGRKSTDMVLARPVTQLAMVSERTIAASMGVRLSSEFPSLVEPSSTGQIGSTAVVPQFVTGVTARRVSRWIEGDTNDNGMLDDADKPEATVLVFDRYTGTPRAADILREPN